MRQPTQRISIRAAAAVRSSIVLVALLASIASGALCACGNISAREQASSHGSRSQGTHAVPCAADAVLRAVCQQCHTDALENGAPFPLVTWEDTQVEIDERPLHEWMRAALESDEMPLPPVTMAPQDRDTLLTWLREGAPPRPAGEVCSKR